MKTSIFNIYHQVSPVSSRPYRIAETILTSDGMRTRLCDGAWVCFEDAEKALCEKVENATVSKERGSS